MTYLEQEAILRNAVSVALRLLRLESANYRQRAQECAKEGNLGLARAFVDLSKVDDRAADEIEQALAFKYPAKGDAMTYVVDFTDSDGKRRTVRIQSTYPLTKEKDSPVIAFRVRSATGHEVSILHEFRPEVKL